MYKNKVKVICLFFIFSITAIVICACSQENVRMYENTGKVYERTVKNGVKLAEENIGGIKESQLLEKLKFYESKLNIPPKNAKVNVNNWTVETESTGKRLNTQKTLNNILSSNYGDNVKLVVEEIKPSVRADVLKRNIIGLASYSTPIIDNQASRVNNIELAAAKLNNTVISAGEEFSFNNTVGRRTEAKGFEEAPIIIRTKNGPKKGYGVGGGVCQVASTLYNAVEKVGMEITERHLHSKDVGYVPDGKDATVSYGSVDFKFRNNRSHPIMLKSYVDNGSLTVSIIENKNL